jgi:uncharacterized protein YecE (DUF72 family)
VGISGWRYAPWRGEFYPEGLPQRAELSYAAERFDTIEVNGTFYRLQRPASFLHWYDETPEDFVFALKGGRYLTHLLRLRDAVEPLADYFGSGVLALREKLGPVLWQLPPTQRFDPEPLEAFLALLPRTFDAARRLVGAHGRLGRARRWTEASDDLPLRYALEVLHESFRAPEFTELLRRHDVALVVADTAGRWPLLREVTSDHVYVRLHGDTELYASGYAEETLEDWAGDIRSWTSGTGCPDGRGRDVYVYFDNDAKVRAPFDAMALRELLRHRTG